MTIGQEHVRAIETHRVTNLSQLIEALESLRSTTLCEGADWDTVYTQTDELPSVGLTLIERTLTDGSKVYDVRVG